jgi:hypothetical protein
MLAYSIVKILILLALFLGLLSSTGAPVWAVDSLPLGVHILVPEEITTARDLTQVDENDQRWSYVTVPFTLGDVGQTERWQVFFDLAKEQRVIPLVRLATKVENNAWVVPTYQDIVKQIDFLAGLNWPTDQKHLIVFNEVNHAKEWGGRIDPAEYARVFEFSSRWAHSENQNFVVLPAAMDLAAPNGKETREAFVYLEQMFATNKDIFSYADAWNSHSYPNPGFSSSPERTEKNSLRGFLHELAYLKAKTDRDYQVYITETGWETSPQVARWLPSYYAYALEHIWSHPQVVAVTPFLLKGAPGPYAGFSFLTNDDKPTLHYTALRQAIDKVYASEENIELSAN